MKKVKLGNKSDDKTKVLKEAQFMNKLYHPNIIKFYHIFIEQSENDDNNYFCILMEYA